MYRDIVKKLAGEVGVKFGELAERLGMSGQARLSSRLAGSWNPGMADAQALLAELGYKIVFVPERTVCKDNWYEPEFPERPVR